ncbi:MAG TPA: glycosyl hydrolase 108 family protein [Oligoflexus sp.]|uniref:glycoside hydrolase family 108 protein n=1 Tax=Oligoflexus sp. TaxID=1971216 RepID=UPI002D2EDB63|nr:glycosyl hydrolase 108 family protein [Oligoflexus sp.]HYX37232.1 glycosyl hydrolase 108 family protein [Oligoflexus sp.]
MTFDEMIDFIIDKIEGGYSNDKRDNGGETKWGISLKSHPELAGRIQSLTRDEAKKIYRREYFIPGYVSKYPSKVRLSVLDGSINHGILGNNRLVQKALKSLGCNILVDGVVGPKTLAALRSVDPLDFIVAHCKFRLALFRGHLDYQWAGAGWESRVLLICARS